MIPEEWVLGGIVAVGGFAAWLIKYFVQELKEQATQTREIISKNTEAFLSVKLTLEKCKFLNEIKNGDI